MDATQDDVEFATPYTPELLAFVARSSARSPATTTSTATTCACCPARIGTFDYSTATGRARADVRHSAEEMFDFFRNSDPAFETYAGPGSA